MKSLRLLALALFVCSCTASAVLACENHKSAKAGATTAGNTVVASNGAKGASGCTAEMAAQCTPAMRAACAKNAVTAGGIGHCAGAKLGSTVTAGVTPGVTVVGMRCSEPMAGIAHDCAACGDWTDLDQNTRAMGARSQVVALKNGVMIVYTADTPASVRALQSLVGKRNNRLAYAMAAGSDAKLCDECRQLRGAIASGKLHREVVNVERGCMTLITSSDRGVVQQIRAMTGQPIAMR